ncbi:hypothetical protein GGU11DRAFT_86126 [Lentinula aff. detonsa]|nr:hypothetical protein GGU11DRAFT_86126 [Lentinula aff. detonsa]
MRDENESQEEDTNQQAIAISPEQDPNSLEKKWPTTDFELIPIPERLQYYPNKPPLHFGRHRTPLSGSLTSVVANLYHCQPLSRYITVQSFNVSYDEISNNTTGLAFSRR